MQTKILMLTCVVLVACSPKPPTLEQTHAAADQQIQKQLKNSPYLTRSYSALERTQLQHQNENIYKVTYQYTEKMSYDFHQHVLLTAKESEAWNRKNHIYPLLARLADPADWGPQDYITYLPAASRYIDKYLDGQGPEQGALNQLFNAWEQIQKLGNEVANFRKTLGSAEFHESFEHCGQSCKDFVPAQANGQPNFNSSTAYALASAYNALAEMKPYHGSHEVIKEITFQYQHD